MNAPNICRTASLAAVNNAAPVPARAFDARCNGLFDDAASPVVAAVWEDFVPVGLGEIDAATGCWRLRNRWLRDELGVQLGRTFDGTFSDFGTESGQPVAWEHVFGAIRKNHGIYGCSIRTSEFISSRRMMRLLLKSAPSYTGSVLVSVEDRTDLLRAQAELQTAHKLASIGRVAGSVAHDFNNVLTATLLQLGIMRQRCKANPAFLADIKDLEAGAWRAAGLSRQLLDFLRPKSSSPQLLDVALIVGCVAQMLVKLIGKGIKLEITSEPELPRVMGDPTLIEQIIMNLVLNARDAQPSGGEIIIRLGRVNIGAANESSGRRSGDYVRLTVADKGCGMNQQAAKQIFEPFYTTKSPGRGTGLGLATVKAAVGEHNGWIDVETAVGVGSTFHVFVPAAVELVSPR